MRHTRAAMLATTLLALGTGALVAMMDHTEPTPIPRRHRPERLSAPANRPPCCNPKLSHRQQDAAPPNHHPTPLPTPTPRPAIGRSSPTEDTPRPSPRQPPTHARTQPRSKLQHMQQVGHPSTCTSHPPTSPTPEDAPHHPLHFLPASPNRTHALGRQSALPASAMAHKHNNQTITHAAGRNTLHHPSLPSGFVPMAGSLPHRSAAVAAAAHRQGAARQPTGPLPPAAASDGAKLWHWQQDARTQPLIPSGLGRDKCTPA